MAQSLFQVGGNLGQALGPLMAAAIVVDLRQGSSIAWFALMALLSIIVLFNVGRWYKRARQRLRIKATTKPARPPELVARRHDRGHRGADGADLLQADLFRRDRELLHVLPDRQFGLSLQAAQLYLFVFLAPVAIGTLAGGLLGDRFGRKHVIWFSVLGALPFTLMLPFVNLFWTGVLSVLHRH